MGAFSWYVTILGIRSLIIWSNKKTFIKYCNSIERLKKQLIFSKSLPATNADNSTKTDINGPNLKISPVANSWVTA